uniref:ATP synthase subunit 8 n=2 Tax=Ciona TaxID=7718 RepID=Q7YEU2_CIOIN|nr:ATP synthase F0 subunit 8 [Ciona robusta]CAD99002.1 ATP synthase subunit 8 [Ciona robusta]CAL23537.1 ATPase subunit 8 [Ciona robusta]CAL23540.1 ATPase subunit 8 [Ciona robusta]CAL23543.1 ATPase subunit 8 [Ciona robusta]CAL23558.1 ATPase subunit 8 [Ciona robusta]
MPQLNLFSFFYISVVSFSLLMTSFSYEPILVPVSR